MKRGILHAIVIVSLVVVVLGLAYAPVLAESYGYNDDYHLLYRIKHGTFDVGKNEAITR